MDPSPEGQNKRTEMAQQAGSIKILSGLAMGGSVVVAAVAFVARRWFPVIGGLIAIGGALVFGGSHEAVVIAGNVEEMTDGKGATGNITKRVAGAWSEEDFVTGVLKDTWVVGPLFRTNLIRELKEDK